MERTTNAGHGNMRRDYPIPNGLNTLEVLQTIRDVRLEDLNDDREERQRASFNQALRPRARTISSSEDAGRFDFMFSVDASSGAVAVTLPESPRANQIYVMVKKDSSGNAASFGGNGKNINGSGSMSVTTQYDRIMIQYVADSDEWIRIGG